MNKKSANFKCIQRGEIIWIDFDPSLGHEQKGHRPAVVISETEYNEASSLLLVCPITSTSKGYPFEVPLVSKKVSGVVLADHVRSIDKRIRKIKRTKEVVSDESLRDILQKIALITGIVR